MFYTCIDVNVDKPDEKSIMTYVAQFLKYYPDPHHTVADVQENEVSFSCIPIQASLSGGCFINTFCSLIVYSYILF